MSFGNMSKHNYTSWLWKQGMTPANFNALSPRQQMLAGLNNMAVGRIGVVSGNGQGRLGTTVLAGTGSMLGALAPRVSAQASLTPAGGPTASLGALAAQMLTGAAVRPNQRLLAAQLQVQSVQAPAITTPPPSHSWVRGATAKAVQTAVDAGVTTVDSTGKVTLVDQSNSADTGRETLDYGSGGSGGRTASKAELTAAWNAGEGGGGGGGGASSAQADTGTQVAPQSTWAKIPTWAKVVGGLGILGIALHKLK